jgi:hypothetical protein
MTPEEARRQALVAMGGLTAAKELHRDTRGLPWLDTLMQDVKYSFRTLRRDAGLTTFAIIIVGLGVGASSTVFNLFNALLLRPLPFSEPDRLAWISNGRGEGMSARTIQSDYILDMREQSKSFSDVAAYYAFYGVGDSRMTGVGEPERLTGVPVTQNFFPLLGVEPKYGRNFSKEESQMRGPRAILLSHRFGSADLHRTRMWWGTRWSWTEIPSPSSASARVVRFRQHLRARTADRYLHGIAARAGDQSARKHVVRNRTLEARRLDRNRELGTRRARQEPH